RGTMAGRIPGTLLGQGGVGIVDERGSRVRNFIAGDRVVSPSPIPWGNRSSCRAGYYSQCDKANPTGPEPGTQFFGGACFSEPFDGLQAEYARIPFANIGMVRVPDGVTDDDAILVSDIIPTAWMAAEIACIHAGSTVAVFGCGPVGQFVIACAKLL